MASLTLTELSQLLGLLLGTLVFIALLVVDVRKAVNGGNLWVPGHALVLSALSIQLMNFVEDRSDFLDHALLIENTNCTGVQNSSTTNVTNAEFTNVIQVQSAFHDQNSTPPAPVKCNKTDAVDLNTGASVDMNNAAAVDKNLQDVLFMVHCSRVMLCVLIAFFLPGMARPGYEDAWTTIGALGFTVFLHIFTEMLSASQKWVNSKQLYSHSYFFFLYKGFYEDNNVWVIVYAVIISISLVCLLLLLICATIASKGIRNITAQRIPLILTNPGENSWKAVEDQVLKSWIVARACNPESIVARSALALAAALTVALCAGISLVSWGLQYFLQGSIVHFIGPPAFWLKFVVTIVEILFILIGGAIICWRGLTSVAYYGRLRRKEENWRSYFRVEDYWTEYIVELQKPKESPLLKRSHDDYNKRANKIIEMEGERKKIPRLLLRCLLWQQWFVVFICKVAWFFSELVVKNKIVHKIATTILSKHLRNVATEFEAYQALLSNVYILSETPDSVFLTNRKSIKRAKEIMENGNDAGKNCKALISFLQHRRRRSGHVGILPLHPGTAGDGANLKFLWKRDADRVLDMARYFIPSSKDSWKLTAVSLMNIISRLPHVPCGVPHCSCGADNLKVYQEAWELMDLVEESDPEIQSLLSKAADRQFMALREQIEKNCTKSTARATRMEEADAAIQGLAQESKREAEINDNGKDTPVDWEKFAAGTALYKICMSIDCSSGDLTELVNELQSTLADTIGGCIEKVGVALVEKTTKWAQEMEERKLLEAVYMAGKSKGLMDQEQP